MSQLTHNRSLWRRAFSSSWLRRYWQQNS